ncbi:hypothetical protein GCM10010869_63040 [Mesorhizobium tianshanense]|nr:hypothetical protein GCM10010869_63040 [Mesorhizobium tianshanense]
MAVAQAQEAPAAPEAWEAPAAPEAWEAPAAPEAWEAPAEPDASEAPAAPEASEAPVAPAAPERITNPVAEFAGIDKITGRIITFDVYIDETVQFGALQVTPRICYSRPQTEEPKTDSFVEVDEITLDRKIRRIFTGWMFAESPGLNAVEHAVYDVWLKSCKQKSDVPAPEAAKTN